MKHKGTLKCLIWSEKKKKGEQNIKQNQDGRLNTSVIMLYLKGLNPIKGRLWDYKNF